MNPLIKGFAMICRSARSGRLRPNLSGAQTFFSFQPTPLPPEPPVVIDREMTALLCKIYADIGLLHGLASSIPDLSLFLAMYVRREALFSSQIERTQATLDDILDPTIDRNANRDVTEVIDNVEAIFFAVEQMKDSNPKGLPLCMRLLRETHQVLLTHSRGQDKNPGEFRSSQNWIGPTGCSLTSASYVPPNLEDMHQALSDLEKFFHQEPPRLDPFINAALIHYQFETIHPFLDGNGRIGRLLILLYLIHAKILTSPLLYISYFLKLHRGDYYAHMMAVRQDGNYEAWIKFFLIAASAALTDTISSIQKLRDLHDNDSQTVVNATTRKSTQQRLLNFLEYLEHKPIIEIKTTAQQLKLSFPTASKLILRFVELGILQETTGKHRSRVFAYENYLAILRKDGEPL